MSSRVGYRDIFTGRDKGARLDQKRVELFVSWFNHVFQLSTGSSGDFVDRGRLVTSVVAKSTKHRRF